MLAPTLYYLTITERATGGYEIWESHCGQECGCVATNDEFVDFVQTKEEALAIVNNWELHPPLGGVLEDVDWNERPSLPDINEDDVTDDFSDTYTDYVELILAICKESGIKPYRVIDNDGRVLKYTFKIEK